MLATRLRQEIVASTYEDFQLMVYSIVTQFAVKYRMPFDDLLTPAHQAFIKACNTYKKETGNLSSWIYQKVSWGLKSFMRMEFRHRHLETIDNVPEEYETPNHFILELRDELSLDARRIVKLLVVSSTEFNKLCRLNKARCRLQLINSVKEHLDDRGWSEQRVKRTMREIDKVLNEEAQEDRGPRYIPIPGLLAARNDIWLLSRVGLTPKQVKKLLR